MKRLLLLLLCLPLLVTQVDAQAQKNWKKGYFPKGVRKLKLGMPYAKLIKKHPAAKKTSDGMDFRTVLVEELNKSEIQSLIYYVDNDGKKPFYELIVQYQAGIDVPEIARDMYGPPNQDDEWYFEHRKGPDVNIWVFKQKLVIAAILPDTEWAE